MWSAKDTLELAEMLHGMPALWDASCEAYKSSTVKDDALAVIAAHFGMNSEDMGKKMKNIRTQFGRALNERKEQSRSGAGVSKKKEWFAFQALEFLGKNNTSVGSHSTMEVSITILSIQFPLLHSRAIPRELGHSLQQHFGFCWNLDMFTPSL